MVALDKEELIKCRKSTATDLGFFNIERKAFVFYSAEIALSFGRWRHRLKHNNCDCNIFHNFLSVYELLCLPVKYIHIL